MKKQPRDPRSLPPRSLPAPSRSGEYRSSLTPPSSKERGTFDVEDLSPSIEVAPASKRHHCVDCGALSPETSANFTLISAQFGWRLYRAKNERGELTLDWRCPGCWETFRLRKMRAP